MTESAKSAQPLFAHKWAVRLGAALLGGLALVVGLVTWDRLQRARLESATETTAVGDGKFFKPPAKLPALLSGSELAPEKIEVRDTHVFRAVVDPETGLGIYKLSEAASDDERARMKASGALFLLKVAPNEYAGAK